MSRAIFEYTKTVLKKVSFNVDLFCKELKKALEKLFPHEVDELRIWLEEYTTNRPELYISLEIVK